jgi:hypothetical protein
VCETGKEAAVRHSRLAIPFAIVLFGAACERVAQPGVGPDARRELDRAENAVVTWITRARSEAAVDVQTAVAAGYLERLRLGLGSPFRLAEYAMDDPRLADTTRVRLAWAILARTYSRDAYEIDPIALDRVGLRRQAPVPGSGAIHLDLIDGAIRQSSDPRAGELAVRLAYMLASLAGDLNRNAPETAGRVAALIRDRELARTDVSRLLRVAGDSAINPLDLLRRWRAERRFEVERPPMEPMTADAELTAMEIAPRLARVIGLLAAGADIPRDVNASTMRGPAALLGPIAAAMLSASNDSLHSPPESPVAVASMLHADELIEAPWIGADQKRIRRAFLDDAINSERFVAGLGSLRSRSPYDAGGAALAVSAAVAMRAWAQEPVWTPGNAAPSTRELQQRWGLAAISFGDDVPAEWRPWFRRLIDLTLTDLSRVLPALNLHGLNIHVTNEGRRNATLALHDPRRRRLVLPPLTAAGTLAHEIAHDLDWQVALERYRVRGDYASDRAVRIAGDRFAERLQNLTAASMESAPSDRNAHANRPAEVFARNVDFFAAVSLAAAGRSNGYLSSVQDDMLTGYGSVRAPDVTGTAGHALVAILDDVAPLYPETRDWFVKRYGLERSLTPYDLVRRMFESTVSPNDPLRMADMMAMVRTGDDTFDRIEAARDAGFGAIDAWVCRAPGSNYYREHETARRGLVLHAARARARGVALDIARRIGGTRSETWVTRRLDGEPGPLRDEPEPALRELLEPVIERAVAAGSVNVPAPSRRIEIVVPAAHCAAGPFPIQALF